MGGKRKRGVKSSIGYQGQDKQSSCHNDVVVKAKNAKINLNHAEETNKSLVLQIFLNTLIMENIVKHLPVHSLSILRTTCKLWNKTMVPEYRKRNLDNVVTITKDNIDTSIQTLSECQEIPFGKYNLINLRFNAPRIQNLLIKIGSVLTRLQLILTTNTFLPIAKFKTLLLEQAAHLIHLDVRDSRSSAVGFWKCKLMEDEEVQKELPNLKEITLTIDEAKNARHKPLDFLLIHHLFNAAINLQLVEINKDYLFTSNNILNGIILEALKEKVANLGKLRQIKCSGTMCPKHLQTLVELSSRKSNALQLKKFSLDYLNNNCFTGNGLLLLNQFLALQAPHLESLTATSAYHNYKLHLPIMNSLTTLKLEADNTSRLNINDDSPNIQFESLQSHFPNLFNLGVKGLGRETRRTTEEESQAMQRKWTAFARQLGHHYGVTHLELSLCDDDGSYLEDLARMFPNVRNLKIKFGDAVVPQVWTVWPKLELMELNVAFRPGEANEIDSSITGIPIDRLESLTVSEVEDGPRLNWKELYKTTSGISDLCCLREFNLRFLHWADLAAYVTDFTGYYGFVANPTLVRIYVNACSNFSAACICAVVDSVGIYGHFIPYDKNLLRKAF